MAVTKMTLQAYSDGKFSSKAGDLYTVFLNPETYSLNGENSYDNSHPPGSAGDAPRFNYASKGNLSFSLLLDGTRVVDGRSIVVSTELEALRNLVFEYQGTGHSPYFVQITWGSFLFQGRATTFNVSYSLFQPSGAPVRAKVEMAFASYTAPDTLAQEADNQSADLTHRYLVKAGDTLPHLCFRIYGDARYYLQVARHNNLVHFSRLRPGTLLHFPPLRATT